MEQDAVNSLVLDGSVDPAMSVWGLFMEADIVVQVVMLLLLLASFWSWAIIFEKVLRLRRLKERAGQFEEAFRSEEHTSELQSLMRISYAVFCLTKKNTKKQQQ